MADFKTLLKINPQVLARVAPFVAYMAVMALTDLIAATGLPVGDLRWWYGIKIALVAALLAGFGRQYRELWPVQRLPPGDVALALVLGIVVFVAWINLADESLVFGAGTTFNPSRGDGLDLTLIAMRLLGATVVVPLMEELFWRSFLLRWIDRRDFMAVDPAQISRLAFVMVAVLFGLEHNLWLAGILAAVVYNGLYIYTKNLWLPILSHAVTNGLLGIWIVAGHHWEFW